MRASNRGSAAAHHTRAAFDRIRQRNYRVDKGGGLAYRRTAAQAVGVSHASR